MQSSPRGRNKALSTAVALFTLLAAGLSGVVLTQSQRAAATTATPTSVAVAGTVDSKIGCSGDWQTDCAQEQMTLRTDGMWSATMNLPAGSFAYKAAINKSWSENYGAHAVPGGANIALTLAAARTVTFVYDPATHWITDDVNSVIATAVGDFQPSAGCPGSWAPACLRSWLEDISGNGTYTFSTTAIPAGSWQTKAALGQSWAVNYGQNGTPGGANIPFTVPANGATTTFSYNSANHVLTVQSVGSGPTPSPSSSSSPSPTPSSNPSTSPSSSPSVPPGTPDTLGALYTPGATTFRIWSPDNSNVSVSVGGKSYPLSPTTLSGYTGIYQTVLTGDLKDQAYQFSVGGNAVRDPYTLMVNPGTTQGIVVDVAAVAPTGGGWAPTPPLANRTDTVVYELSVRDYTIDASSGVEPAKRGKFLGLVQTGTTDNGIATGIDHLKALGVTTVQIMPSFDFNSTVPNWGYDPANYNVPEEQYSQFTSPEDRIREFKDMVNGFHQYGIRVIMDVVYNHTYSKDVFGNITGKYYTPNDLSGTGNSLDDSNPMVARMIQDSLEHWVRDYNVDGFRFDLLGVHYAANAAAWGNYLNAAYPARNLVIYGEPWSATSDPLEAQKVRYGTVPTLAGAHVGVFNGAFRDAIRGGTRDNVMAYMGGNGDATAIALGMRGSPVATKSTAALPNLWNPAFAYSPEQTMNYVSIHDDLNLYDKITYSGATGGAAGQAGQIDKFAVGMVLTSQGIPVIAEGDEFLRSKVVGGDYNTAMNSYNASDAVNAIHWGDEGTNASVVKYYKDAIAFRKSDAALRLTSWDAVNSQMSTQENGSIVVSELSSNAGAPTSYDTVVVVNPTTNTYNVTLPAGTWTKVLDATGAVSATDTACAGRAVTVFRKS